MEDITITRIHFGAEPEGDTNSMCLPLMIIQGQRSIKKRICFNLFSQDQATQRCNLLKRENEKLRTQLTAVGEALERCHRKYKNLKRNGEAKINESACDLSIIILIIYII